MYFIFFLVENKKYNIISFLIENKKYNILFIKKSKNFISSKISVYFLK